MYGLKQATRLAYDNLVTNLKKDEYFPDKYCPNIWSHESRPTNFVYAWMILVLNI